MAKPGPKKNPDKLSPYRMPFTPRLVKELVLACDISQGELAEAVAAILGRPISRATINLIINKGYIPPSIAGFAVAVEKALGENPAARAWLSQRGMEITDIWRTTGEELRQKNPAGHGRRALAWKQNPAMIPGNLDDYNEEAKQMRKLRIPEEVLKYNKLFRDPFLDDPRSEKEVFRSADHRFLEYAMYDAATNSGLLAIIAEVGAGKTVMRREVIERLRGDEKIRIVYPQIIDRARITAGSLCDAIVMDLAPSDKRKQQLEDKSRHVRKLLSERLSQGKRVCLIIEEAHRLAVSALKHIKVFHEIEEGRQKLLSIILLGQTELGELLDEEQYPELRELSRRVQIATIPGLGDGTWDYLALKFKIVGGDIERIITPEAVQQLVSRLTAVDDTGKKISQAYPLTVNNYTAKAMIEAFDRGEEKITLNVVNSL